MAASARRVVVEFLGEDKSLGKSMDGLGGKSNKLIGILGKVGKAAAVGLAVGAAAGAVGLVKLTQGAIEDEAAQAKLAKTLQNATGATDKQVASVENWISKQGVALGVADDDLRPALQRLAEATGDVGKAQQLTSLAMDISAGTGKSLKTVSEALAKAQMGQVGGLSRYGIATRDASGEMMSFEDVVKRASGTFEGQATTAANTLDGKMARLKLILSETGETIGAKLIPVVTQMADWFLNRGVPALSAFGGWIQRNILPALQRMGEWIQAKVIPALQIMGEWIASRVLPIFQRLGSEGPSIFAKVRGAMEPVIKTVISIAQNVGGKLRPVFDQLIDTFRSRVLPTVALVIDRFMEWWPAISRVVSKIADLGATILGKVLPPVIRFAGFLLANVVPAVLDVIGVLGKIIGKMVSVGGAFIDGVQAVAKWVGGVKEKIANALQVVGGIPGKAKDALAGIGTALLAAGQSLIQGLIDGITSKVAALRDKLQSVTKLIPDWKGPLDKDKILLTPAGVALMEGLIKGIDKGKKKLQTVLEKVTAYIQGKQDKLADVLSKRQGIIDAFGGFGQSIFGANTATEDSPASVQKIVDFSADQKNRADQLNASVGSLIAKGLSKDLIQQMIDQGQSGVDQINLLATATDEQIRQLNANNAATTASLAAAGLKAADAMLKDQLDQATRDVALADGIRDKLRELLDKQDKNTVVELHIDGKVLHASLLKLKREKRGKLNLD